MAVRSGTIILINGASSSGKSSILRALQDLLPVPYIEMGLDKFVFMLPKRYLDRPEWDEVMGLMTRAGPLGERLVSGMHHAIRDLSLAGVNVLADHVIISEAWWRECAALFCDLPAYAVGVRCALEVLEEREKSRRNRTLGQARAVFPLIHAFGLYDLEVDSGRFSAEACAAQIAGRLAQPDAPDAFRRLDERFRSRAA